MKAILKQTQQVLKNFIVIEGLDGSGTTTQLLLMKKKLKTLNIPFFSTFEPTKSDAGKLIRKILKGEHKAHPHTLAFLFAADRNEHIHDPVNGILASHLKGECVICDRYLFSSLAYQSVIADFNFILALNAHFPLPSHLFFLETPVKVCMERLSHRQGREIFEHTEFQEQVLKGYRKTLNFFKDFPFHIHRIDGTLSKEKVFSKIWEITGSLPIIKK